MKKINAKINKKVLIRVFTVFLLLITGTTLLGTFRDSEVKVESLDLLSEKNSLFDDVVDARLIVITEKEEVFQKLAGLSSATKVDENVYLLQFDSKLSADISYGYLSISGDVDLVSKDMVIENASTEEDDFNFHDPEDEENTVIHAGLQEYLIKEPTDKNEVIVAVLDSGISQDFSQADRILSYGSNFSSDGEPGSCIDNNGHGTNMASLILENTYANVKILPIKFLNDEGKGTIAGLYLGIREAIDNNVNIINISASTPTQDKNAHKLINTVLEEAKEKGILVVTSAGNNDGNVKNYLPAGNDYTFTISSVDRCLNRSKFSNYGNTIDYAVIGENVYCPENNKKISGTSASTARFTSILAQILGADSSKTAEEIKIILDEYVIKTDIDKKYVGNGILSYDPVSQIIEENGEDSFSEMSGTIEKNINDIEDWKSLSDEKFNNVLFEGSDINNAIFVQGLTEEELRLAVNKSSMLRGDITFDEGGNLYSKNYCEYLLSMDLNAVNANAAGWFTATSGWDFLKVGSSRVKLAVTLSSTDQSKEQSISWNYVWDSNSNPYVTGMESHTKTLSSKWTHSTLSNSAFLHYLPSYYETFRTKLTINVPTGYYTSSTGNDGDASTIDACNTWNLASSTSDLLLFSTSGVNYNASGTSYTLYLHRCSQMMGVKYGTNSGSNKTVHATYTIAFSPNTYTVTYDGNGGTWNNTTTWSNTATYNSNYYIEPNFFTRSGYKFVGWSESKTGTDPSWQGWEGKFWKWTYTRNVTLYAIWEKADYTIKVNPNGGIYNKTTDVTSYGVGSGDYELIANPTRPGYKFNAWKWEGPPGEVYSYINGYSSWHAANNTTKFTRTISSDWTYTNYKWEGIKASADSWNYISFPYYSVSTNETITISGYVRVNSIPVVLNFYHGAKANDYLYPMFQLSEKTDGWKYFEFSRTFTEATDTATFEVYTGNLNGLNGATLDYDLKEVKIKRSNGQIVESQIYVNSADVTLTAQWELYNYTITLDNQGAETAGTAAYYEKYGVGNYKDLAATQVISSITVPKKPGYTFGGYYTEENGNGTKCVDESGSIISASTYFTDDTTLYAHWTKNEYTLFYYPNEGDGEVITESYTYGESYTVKASDTFTRPGYTFTGWNDKADGSGTSYTAGSSKTWMTEGNLSLYAQWEPNVYTITLDSQSATTAGTTSFYIKYDTGIYTTADCTITRSSILIPLKTGYTFAGYYTEKNGEGTPYVDASGSILCTDTTFTEDIILYAHWTKNEYTLFYYPNEGDGEVITEFYTYGESYTVKASDTFTRPGYTFTGWNDKADGSGTSYTAGSSKTWMTEGNLSLYAQWEPNVYTITLDSQSATMAGTTSFYIKYKTGIFSSLACNVKISSITVPSKTGYSFGGYYTEENGEGDQYIDASGSIVCSSTTFLQNTTLYAHWMVNSCNIIYDANDGDGTMASTSATFGSSVTLRKNTFTRTGYEFKGWSTTANGSVEYEDEQTIPNFSAAGSTLKLYAVWEIDVYSITLDNQGATTAGTTGFYAKYNAGTYADEACTSATSSITIPTWTGKTFTGYYDSTGTCYINSAGAITAGKTMFTKDITLTARWKTNTYTIQYDANGGSGTMEPAAAVYGMTVKLAEREFTRTGYEFKGWSVTANGPVEYLDKQEVLNLTAEDGKTITLYAVWEANTYTVTLDAQGAQTTGTTVYYQKYDKGNYTTSGGTQTISTITKPVWTGKTFGGYYTEKNGKGTCYINSAGTITSGKTTFTENTTLYAYWTTNVYFIQYDKNGGTGTMANTEISCGTSAELNKNKFTRKGYEFKGWSVTANGPVEYRDEQEVLDLSTEAGRTIILYAVWEVNIYTITLDSAGAEKPGTMVYYQKYESGIYSDVDCKNTISNITVPQKTGQTFVGYYDGTGTCYINSAGTITSGNTTFTEDIILTARWRVNTYTIQYDANGGTGTMENTTAVYGTSAKLAERKFTRTGYEFKGWSTTANGTVKFQNEEMVLNLTTEAGKIIILYAVWEPNVYTVTLDAQGAETAGTKVYYQKYDKGNYTTSGGTQTISAITKPTWTGKTFGGYYTGKNGTGTCYINSAGTITSGNNTFTENMTLYAYWTTNVYFIQYDKNGGTGTMANTEISCGTSAKLSKREFTRTGYEFKGWSTTANGPVEFRDEQEVSDLTTEAGRTIILYAVWQANTYTITLDAQGADIASTTAYYQKYDKGNYTTSGCTQTISTIIKPVWTGKTFGGYYTEKNGKGTCYINSAGTIISGNNTFTENTTLYAYWTTNVYFIQYDANGGTGTMANTEISCGTSVKLSKKEFTRTGYEFKGWSTTANGPVEFQDEQEVSDLTTEAGKTITLYAVWEADTYTITLDAQGAETAGTTAYYQKYDKGNYTTSGCTQTISTITKPTWTGKTFGGYYTEKNGKGTCYINSTGTIIAEKTTFIADTTLYAYWTVNTYTIKYNANGGTGSMADTSVTYGTSVNLEENAFTRSGYKFMGWATSANGNPAYRDKEEVINLTKENGATVNLYAVWGVDSFNVSYDANGGIGSSYLKTYNFGESVDLRLIAEKPGYRFIGWSTFKTARIPLQSYIMPNTNVTLYAVYTISVSDVENHEYPSYEGTADISDDEIFLKVWIKGSPSTLKTYPLTYKEDTNPMVYRYELPQTDITSFVNGRDFYYQLIAYDNAGNYTVLKEGGNNGEEEIPDTEEIPQPPAEYLQTVKHYKYKATTDTWEWFDTTTEIVKEGVIFNPSYITVPVGYYASHKDSASTVTGPKTYCAYYRPNPYTLTFDAGEGICNPASKTVTYDDYYGTLPTPERPGYTFTEWNTKEDGTGEKVTSGNIYDTAGDSTIHAQWKPNVYTITLNGNGAETAGTAVYFEKYNMGNYTTADCTETISTITKPAWTGHTFTGYYDSTGAGSYINASGKITAANTTFTENTILYAHWTENKYTITFHANGSSGSIDDLTLSYEEQKNLPSNTFTKTGYTFKGWSTSENGDVVYEDRQAVQKLTPVNNGIINLYALWEPVVYTIELDANDAENPGTTAYYQKYDKGNYTAKDCTTAITSIVKPIRTGYTFDGYYTKKQGSEEEKGIQYIDATGKVLSTSTTFTSDTTLHAYWTTNQYTIQYNANGGTGSMEDTKATYDKEEIIRSNDFTRTGYMFRGWATSKTGSVVYEDKAAVKNLIAENGKTITLYAVWSPNVYTIKLDSQSAETAGTTAYYQKYEKGNYTTKDCATAISTITKPVRPGYTFKGYYTGKEGTGTQYIDAAGKILSTGTTFTSDTMLYAHWTVNSYTVKYNANGGTGTMADTEAKYNEKIELSANTFIRTGYKFIGWATSEGGNEVYADRAVIENLTAENGKTITLYAVWSPKVYTIKLDSQGAETTGTTAYYQKFDKGNYTTKDCTTAITSIVKPTRTGYTFGGYYTEKEGKGTQYIDATGKILSAGTTFTTDTMLYAHWTVNSYTVKYNANGGTGTMADTEAKYNEKIELSANTFIRTGYKFIGWATSAGGNMVYADCAFIKNLTAENGKVITLYAVWSPNVYTIKLDSQGAETAGTTAYYQKFDKGNYTEKDCTTAITSITNPTKTGYTFGGYYTEKEGSEEGNGTQYIDAAGKILSTGSTFTTDTTLYAHWGVNSYKVKYDANGGTGTMADTEAKYNEKIELSANTFTRTGYTFKGWSTSAGGNVVYADREAIKNLASENGKTITLYAVWSPTVYIIKLDGQSAETAGTTAYYQKYDKGNYTDSDCTTAITSIVNPTRTGYTFGGYYAEKEGKGTQYIDAAGKILSTGTTFTSDTMLYAYWTVNSYTVKYNANGGTGTMDETKVSYNETVALSSNSFTRTGYTFIGWATSEGGNMAYADRAAIKNLTAENGKTITLYAVWSSNVYTIKLDNQSAETTGTTSYYEKYNTGNYTTADCNVAITSIVNPTRTGYTFGGYYTGKDGTGTQYIDVTGKILSTSTTFTTDTMLYAYWTVNSYTVKYNANGGTGTMEDSAVKYNETATLSSNVFTKTGYAFKGWATFASGNVVYTDKAAIKNLTAENGKVITLYAVWETVVYTITLDSDEGENAGTTAYYEKYDKGNYTSKDCTTAISTITNPTKTGYTFSGYYTEKAGTGTQYVDATGRILSAKTTFTDDITLYAYWIPNTYTFKYNANGGTGTMADTSATYGEFVTLRTNSFTRTGYEFMGWATSEKGAVVYENSAMIKNVTAVQGGIVPLYAVWQSVVYEITFDDQDAIAKGTESYYEKYNTGNYTTADCDKTISTITKPGMTGYIFKGYYTGKNGTGTQYVDETGKILATAKTFTEHTTLYAYWTPITYKIQYNTNGGDGTMTETSATYDIPVTLATNLFYKTGYTFKGWSTTANGSVEYQDKAEVKNMTAANGSSVTLYAVWDVNPYTVTYDYSTNGGNTVSVNALSFDYGAAIDLTVTAKKDGYVFVGWNTDSTATTALPSLTMGTEPITLYAIYKKDIMVTFVEYGNSGTVTSTQTKTVYNNVTHAEFPVKETASWTGWQNIGWTTETDAMSDSNVASGATYTTDRNVTQYARYHSQVQLSYDTNGATVTIDALKKDRYYNAAGDSEYPQYTVVNAPVLQDYSFVNWKIESGRIQDEHGNSIITTNPRENILVLEDTVLKAVWDKHPVIEAYNRHFTMDEANAGKITEAELLETVKATDEEAKNAVNPDGVLENGVDVIVKNYNASDFTGITEDKEIHVTYQATDSFGNTVTKTVTITITDTTMQKSPKKTYVRFISSEFLVDETGDLISSAEGGLEETSIWRTNTSYRDMLKETVLNTKTNVVKKEVSALGQTWEVEVAGSGEWAKKEDTWVFTRNDIQEMKQFTIIYGHMQNAIEEFWNLFQSCKQSG